MNKIAAFDREIRMLRQTHAQKKIPTLAATRAGFPLTSKTNPLTLVNTARDFYLICLNFIRPGATQGNCSFRSVERFLERDQNVCFDIRAALGRRFATAKSAESRPAAPPAEKRFEEIAETRSEERRVGKECRSRW